MVVQCGDATAAVPLDRRHLLRRRPHHGWKLRDRVAGLGGTGTNHAWSVQLSPEFRVTHYLLRLLTLSLHDPDRRHTRDADTAIHAEAARVPGAARAADPLRGGRRDRRRRRDALRLRQDSR